MKIKNLILLALVVLVLGALLFALGFLEQRCTDRGGVLARSWWTSLPECVVPARR